MPRGSPANPGSMEAPSLVTDFQPPYKQILNMLSASSCQNQPVLLSEPPTTSASVSGAIFALHELNYLPKESTSTGSVLAAVRAGSQEAMTQRRRVTILTTTKSRSCGSTCAVLTEEFSSEL